MEQARRYHHGDLRRALLAATVEAIELFGPTAFSLRDVARRAGVTHPAAAYHFGDKAGLLTALATEGFGMVRDRLAEAQRTTGSFLEVGIAYVRFATEHQAHFEVMYRPELYRGDDPDLIAAKKAAATLLYGSDHPDLGQLSAGVAAWAFVHGIATLWLNGNLPPELGANPQEITRLVAPHLPAARN